VQEYLKLLARDTMGSSYAPKIVYLTIHLVDWQEMNNFWQERHNFWQEMGNFWTLCFF